MCEKGDTQVFGLGAIPGDVLAMMRKSSGRGDLGLGKSGIWDNLGLRHLWDLQVEMLV